MNSPAIRKAKMEISNGEHIKSTKAAAGTKLLHLKLEGSEDA